MDYMRLREQLAPQGHKDNQDYRAQLVLLVHKDLLEIQGLPEHEALRVLLAIKALQV
jgi:hypothetical protein